MLSAVNMTLDTHPKIEEPDTKSGFLDLNSSHPGSMPPVSLPHNSFGSPYPPSYLNNYPPMDTGYPHATQGYPFGMNNAGSYPYGSAYSPSRMGYPPDPYQTNVSSLMSNKGMADR